MLSPAEVATAVEHNHYNDDAWRASEDYDGSPIDSLADALEDGVLLAEELRTMLREAVEMDRAQRPKPIVILSDGEVYDHDDVTVVDMTGTHDAIRTGEMDADDIEALTSSLREQGWDDNASTIESWWERRSAHDHR